MNKLLDFELQGQNGDKKRESFRGNSTVNFYIMFVITRFPGKIQNKFLSKCKVAAFETFCPNLKDNQNNDF